MTKFYPGPWFVVRRYKGSFASVITRSPDDAMGDICNVLNMRGDGERALATANLIAAAPKMLEALLSVGEITPLVSEAIALAEGRTHARTKGSQ